MSTNTNTNTNNTTTVTTTHKIVSFRDRRGVCAWVLNFLWVVLFGWHLFVVWFAPGLLLCLTIIGIPCGVQLFKIAFFLLFPFGKSLVYDEMDDNRGGGCCCLTKKTFVLVLNVVWAVTVGWLYCLQALGVGVFLMVTIIGIPFGWQFCKVSYVCLFPFGKDFTAQEQRVVIEHTVAAIPTPTNVDTTPLLLDDAKEKHDGDAVE